MVGSPLTEDLSMRSDTTYLKLILILSLLGILVSGYLLSIHVRFTSGQASLTESCTLVTSGEAQGCANVAVSNYSAVLGVPVAAIAMGFYVALLMLVFWAMRNYQSAYEPLYVSFLLSTLSIVVTVIMFYISRFVLKAFCEGCAMLWLINLAIWPCFVKQLGLGWGNAVAANLELLRPGKLNLKRERVSGSLVVAIASVLIFAVIGASAKGLGGQASQMGTGTLISEFQSAGQVFLPPESYGGPQAKGQVEASPVPVLDIVEFADFQCPACRMAAQFLKPFAMKYKDKVRLTFHNFPLDGSCNPLVPHGQHSFACAAARHGICAGKQGKFWAFHDRLFDRQDEISTGVIADVAEKAGLDKAELATCLASSDTESQLQKEIQWGELIHLESTPTIVINGRKLSGAKSPEDLEELLLSVEKQARK